MLLLSKGTQQEEEGEGGTEGLAAWPRTLGLHTLIAWSCPPSPTAGGWIIGRRSRGEQGKLQGGGQGRGPGRRLRGPERGCPESCGPEDAATPGLACR